MTFIINKTTNVVAAKKLSIIKIYIRLARLPYYKNIVMIGIVTAGIMITALSFSYLYIRLTNRKDNDFNIYS
jgi:hypothetical protein